MPSAVQRWTAAMVRALPDDGQRHEVVDGVHLVSPAPRLVHQRAVQNLGVLLREYVQASDLGEAWWVAADVELDEHTLVMPDVFVTRKANDWRDIGTPRFIIEVLSPRTARSDRHLKRRRYQRAEVAEYWIVDLDARLVERWRPGDERPEILAEAISWQPEEHLPPLAIELNTFFAEALGER